MYEPQVRDRNAHTTHNWHQQLRAMVNKCAFGIQVGCEATVELQQLLEEGNEAPPETTAQADGQPLLLGPERPQQQFELTQPTRVGGPDRYYNMRPDRTWRCTLGETEEGVTASMYTNMCAVQDQHCAEYDPSEGTGLKPPTCNIHVEIPHDNARKHISRLTHFTVHLHQRIGHIGFKLRVLVGHFNATIASRTYASPDEQILCACRELDPQTPTTFILC